MAGTLNLSLAAAIPLRRASSSSASSSAVRFPPSHCTASMHFATENRSTAVATRRPASLYEVLQVNQNASPREIKSAYRSLAKIYHPDLNRSESEDDDKDFIEIHNAYATLSDPSARAIYDLSLMAVHNGRRRPVISMADIQNLSSSGFYTTRRWETDQCW